MIILSGEVRRCSSIHTTFIFSRGPTLRTANGERRMHPFRRFIPLRRTKTADIRRVSVGLGRFLQKLRGTLSYALPMRAGNDCFRNKEPRSAPPPRCVPIKNRINYIYALFGCFALRASQTANFLLRCVSHFIKLHLSVRNLFLNLKKGAKITHSGWNKLNIRLTDSDNRAPSICQMRTHWKLEERETEGGCKEEEGQEIKEDEAN